MKLWIQISEIEPGKFRASCLVLPGCIAYAQTRDGARQKLDKAVTGYLASLNIPLTTSSARMFELQET